jgi:hypothetical protein
MANGSELLDMALKKAAGVSTALPVVLSTNTPKATVFGLGTISDPTNSLDPPYLDPDLISDPDGNPAGYEYKFTV